MPREAVIRSYADSDLGRLVALWESAEMVPTGPDGLTVDEAADLVVSDTACVLVADRGSETVGMILAVQSGPVGRVLRVVGDGRLAEELIDEVEARLVGRGARRIEAVVGADGAELDVFRDRGYEPLDGVAVLTRRTGEALAGRVAATELGGRRIDPGLWDSLEGMKEAKDVIEQRIILPIAERDLADRHGVSAPRAVVLFGPPGTGKTTFAKGVASRLGWPFVEVDVPRSSGRGEEASTVMARTFDQVIELPAAVVFLDEVEDLASRRREAREVSSKVTNEFLRQIPRLRDVPQHLLVCATNRVGDLDPAFLRPGRFDYVLPVGPPDAAARAAIWRGYIGEITDRDIDVDAIVDASERFTPADIEFAARKAAQIAFEQEYRGDRDERAGTQEFLDAIEQTPPTLTDRMIDEFEADRERYARY